LATNAPTDNAMTDEPALEPWRARFVQESLGGFLDTASHGPQADDHRRALHAYMASWGTGHAPWSGVWQGLHDDIVERTAALVGAASSSLTLVPSMSHALLGCLSALVPERGRDRIVVSEREWVSTRHVLAADDRYHVDVVPADEPCDGDDFLARIDERTRLIVVSQICFRTGAHVDVARITRRAHDVGALVFNDVYQAAGAVLVDVSADAIDFAGGGYLKHMLGGPGVAWLFVRPGLVDTLAPRLTGWRGQRDPMDPSLALAAGAQRFASGTWPVPSLYLARAGLDLIESAGSARIAAQIARLARRFAERCASAGLDVVTPRASAERGPLVVLRVPDAAGVGARLAERGIVLTARDGTLRASFHAHLRLVDVDDACDALFEALASTKETR
jgi:kynureninase